MAVVLVAVGSLTFAVALATAGIIATPEIANIAPDPSVSLRSAAGDIGSDPSAGKDLSAAAVGADESFHEEGMHVHAHAGEPGASQPTTTTPLADQRSLKQMTLDWCRWSAFSNTAADLNQHPSLDVYAMFVHHLLGCLRSFYPGDSNNATYATYVWLQNEVALLLALYPGSTVEQVKTTVMQGVTLPRSVWIAWLDASAAAVPPV